MVAKSVVDGNSCLPNKCIQDADLRLLAGMLQRKAVEALGPASVGQQPVEALGMQVQLWQSPSEVSQAVCRYS